MERFAVPGRSAMAANQSRTCPGPMPSTARWPRTGRISLWTMRRLACRVRGFQWRAWRSRNSAAKSAMGRPGYRGPAFRAGGSASPGRTRRASWRAWGTLMASADPRVTRRTRPPGVRRRRKKERVPEGWTDRPSPEMASSQRSYLRLRGRAAATRLGKEVREVDAVMMRLLGSGRATGGPYRKQSRRRFYQRTALPGPEGVNESSH